MDTLKKYFNDASLWKSPVSKEIGFLGLITLIAIFSITYHKYLPIIHSVQVLEALRSETVTKSVSTAVTKISVTLNETEKEVIQKLIAITTSYEIDLVQNAYLLTDHNYFSERSKSEVESQIINSIPLELRIKAKDYIKAVLLLSEKHQVDPLWILSVMWTESHFKFAAKSVVGARGLMQIMPKTKEFILKTFHKGGGLLAVNSPELDMDKFFPLGIKKGHQKRFKNKLLNIELGIIYLKRLLKRFGQSHKYATVAYNMGPGWTRGRLRRKLPVGTKNKYLTKVRKAYMHMAQRI